MIRKIVLREVIQCCYEVLRQFCIRNVLYKTARETALSDAHNTFEACLDPFFRTGPLRQRRRSSTDATVGRLKFLSAQSHISRENIPAQHRVQQNEAL